MVKETAACEAEVKKFKATQSIVVVLPSFQPSEWTLKQRISGFQILLALQLSKRPFDMTVVSEYDALSAGAQKFPLPLLHHRPTDLCLFEPLAISKFLLEVKEFMVPSESTHLEEILKKFIDLYERTGPLKKPTSALVGLCNELNQNFSPIEHEQIAIVATLKQVQVDEILLSGQVNELLKSFDQLNYGVAKDIVKELLTSSSLPSEDAAASSLLNESMIYEEKQGAEWKPVVPCEDGSTRNVLITSALPYVNNVPHLGNIIGAVLSADVYARYCRRKGYRVLYICGTDEYGTATETKALEEGMSCKAVCDKYFKMHAAIYDWFQIKFDAFGRSSTPVQTEITHEIFEALYGNGFFFEKTVDQCYCEGCARFLADRYVEGICPLCSFTDARGDQCDGCGKLLNAIELKSPQCKLCRGTPIIRASSHLFLDLTKLQGECEEYVEQAAKTGGWSANSLSIARAWLTEGLKPRCMTRDLKWGTSVPIPGYEEKVFYVWFDAPIGYISITAGYDPSGWRKWWQNPEEVELHQFMGKDNVLFHTVIFPATLLGTRQPWTLMHNISTTEYLNYEGGKFSKSRATGVFGSDARDSGIPVSVWRYYLLSSRPESMDAAFSWSDFVAKTNSELLANLGNFVNRTTRFVSAKLASLVPPADLNEADRAFMAEKVDSELERYHQDMEACRLRGALKAVMAISAAGNLYLAEQRLDNKLLQSNPSRCGTVLAVALNLCYILSALLEPFIPATAEDILKILRLPACRLPIRFEILIRPGHLIGAPFHLFTKLDERVVEELKAKFAGKRGASLSVTESAAH